MRSSLGQSILALCLSGCTEPEVECELQPVLDDLLAGQSPTDCGTLAIVPEAADVEAAQACVLDAYEAEQAFQVILAEQGIDSNVRTAFYGLDEGGSYAVGALVYDSDPSGGSQIGARISRSSCSGLAPAEYTDNTGLGLQCLDATPAGEVCGPD